jgi:NADP-dependent aldehyde dehydrogenase
VAEHGLPDGVLGVVFGTEAGVRALKDGRVKAAGFTGSTHAGRLLFDIASGRPDPIPFYGELGSINPAVVTPDALAARADDIARGFVDSFTLGTGQFCTKPGLLFLPAGQDLSAAVATMVDGVVAAPFLNARIGDQFAEGISRLAAHPAVQPVASAGPGPATGSWGSAAVYRTTASAVAADPAPLTEEHFGPAALLVEYTDADDLLGALTAVEGSLTATIHCEPSDTFPLDRVLAVVQERVGRIVFNGWPTGVAVTWSMQHGGPWPATTAAGHTSVGATAMRRWLRPVCFQDAPAQLLPEALRDGNPWGIPRRVDGQLRLPG